MQIDGYGMSARFYDLVLEPLNAPLRDAARRFPRGWLTRGLTALLELAAGPRHFQNGVSYLRAGGIGPLANAAGLVVEATRPAAGGSILIASLRPA